jgi:hypothetical protein
MFAFRCQRMFLLLACLQLALPLYGALAQDEGRPVHIHSDERRKVDETRVEDRGLKDERRGPEKAVTDIERAGREIDIKKNSNGEFVDANRLSDLIKESESKRKDLQATHSWSGHEAEFGEIGIKSVDALKGYIEEIRRNPDIHMTLPRGRELYAKFDNGREGTIVIDNPSDKDNGGTAFRNQDARQRVKELSAAP